MDYCMVCDEELVHPVQLDCEHEFCFHCLLPWLRWSLMNTMLVCPLCDEEVVHMSLEIVS